MNLVAHSYGKQRVRVLKVLRESPRHEVKELEIGVRLEGDFASSYLEGDNSQVVATDTMKNTVQGLAHQHLETQTEPFALLLARHFLDRYPQVERVTVETGERRWGRLTVDGVPHDHAFLADAGRPVVKIVAARGKAAEIESGIEDLAVLKSTGSAFTGFPRDEWTTLPETDDRIFSTAIQARWRWAESPADFNTANAAVLTALLRIFALRWSPSVQTTLYEMAEAALEAVPEIAQIQLALPNRHYLPANLQPLGIDATGVSFVPTDEPYGLIEAAVSRSGLP